MMIEQIMDGAMELDANDDEVTGFSAEDRLSWVNASEIGGCIRKQWYERNRPPEVDEGVEQFDQGYSWRGTAVEMFVADALGQTGFVAYDNLQQMRLFDAASRISGTPDGYYVPRDQRAAYLYEAKSSHMGAKWVQRLHSAQVQTNLELAWRNRGRLEALGDVKLAPNAYLIRISTGSWSDIEETHYKRSAAAYKKLQRRASLILDAADVGYLEREGKLTGQCAYCPFQQACGVELPKRKNKRGANRVAPLLDELLSLQDAVARDKELRAELKEEMLAEELPELDAKTGSAKIRTQKGRRSFDRKAAEADGLDLSPYDVEGAPYQVLTIKKED